MRGLVVPSLLIVFWEAGSLAGFLPPDSASRPSEIVRALVQVLADGSVLRDTWLTLEAALLGFAIAGVLGVLLGRSSRLRAIAAVALIPLALLVFAFGSGMEAVIVAFAAVWPLLLTPIAVGLRLALAISLVVAVTVEIVVNLRGLGHGIVSAQQALRADLVYAQVLWLGFVGLAADHGLRVAARQFAAAKRAK
jgi:NitT/TauT family transport system permease protein